MGGLAAHRYRVKPQTGGGHVNFFTCPHPLLALALGQIWLAPILWAPPGRPRAANVGAGARGLLPALGSGPAPAPGQLELNYWRVAQHQTLNYPIAKLHLSHRGFTATLQGDHRAHTVGVVAYLVAELNTRFFCLRLSLNT